MCSINFIPPVNISDHQEVVQTRPQQFTLVRGHVSPQEVPSVYVVAVRLRPARVIRRNQQVIKVLLSCDYRRQVIVNTKRWVPPMSERGVKIVHNSLPYDR